MIPNKNIVFITNIKNPSNPTRSEAYDLSVESWKRWCLKNDCELFVLNEMLFDSKDMSPIYFRHYWSHLLPDVTTERVCLVDADTIIHPDCPNFFDLSGDDFGAVHNDGDYDWIIRSIENYQYEFPEEFGKQFNIWQYINAGFVVTSKKFAHIHDELVEFYWKNIDKVKNCQQKYGVGTDQPILNLILNQSDIKVRLLPYQFNMQDLSRKNILDERLLYTKIPGIYHFNAISGGPDQVNYYMSKTFKKLYE